MIIEKIIHLSDRPDSTGNGKTTDAYIVPGTDDPAMIKSGGNMKKYLLLLITACMLCFACSGDDAGTKPSSLSNSDSSGATSTSDSPTTDETNTYTQSVAATASDAGYDTTDLVANTTFANTITIDLAASTAQLDTDDVQTFSTSTSVTPLTGVTISGTTGGVTITNTSTTIIKYILSGTLAGSLTVTSANANYQLYLNGVTVNGTTDAALYLASSTKAFIVLADGTTNTFTDQASGTHTGETESAFYGVGPLIFSGTGTLAVTGRYANGLGSKDYIRVCNGTMNISVSANNGIDTKNAFYFDYGNLTINATGATIDDESKGIRVKAKDSAAGANKGYIYINGGTINITSVSKAITAAWDIDEDTTTYTTANPNPFVVINNGVITIKTTGTPYEYEDSTGTTVSCSPEGIEGKAGLTINNGFISVITTDDCLNSANGNLTINGGYIYCASSSNDAIDSNGTLTITGGYIVAIGTSSPEGPFDCDNNTFAITGGTLVGIGGTTSRPTAASCSQYVVVLGSSNISLTAGSTLALVSSTGTVAFAYEIPQSSYTMVISSPDIAKGTYYVYTGTTVTADDDFNGMYLDTDDDNDTAYSGGSNVRTITVSSTLTKMGGQYFN